MSIPFLLWDQEWDPGYLLVLCKNSFYLNCMSHKYKKCRQAG